MKILPEHYEYLNHKLTQVMDGCDIIGVTESYKNRGLTFNRFCWDVLWASRIKISHSHNTCDLPLYDYMDDTHLKTAIKKIVTSYGISSW